jgi:monovalent cation/proton antiporter MnhG/PhaG subunit
MTSFFIDAGIFLLLAISVGFAGIGIIGLLVFPDIRSRMYTATRATVIGMCAMMLAGLLYAVTTFLAGAGETYLLLLDIVILLLIIVIANSVIYRLILKRTKTKGTCDVSSAQEETRE